MLRAFISEASKLNAYIDFKLLITLLILEIPESLIDIQFEMFNLRCIIFVNLAI